MLVSPSAASTLPSGGCLSAPCPQRRTCVRTRTTGPDEHGSGGSSRDIHQIKRLRYLLDAREAKVQAVLDEAMSWLIVPFGAEADCEGEKDNTPDITNSSAPNSNEAVSGQELAGVSKVLSGEAVSGCVKDGTSGEGKVEGSRAAAVEGSGTPSSTVVSNSVPSPPTSELPLAKLPTADVASEVAKDTSLSPPDGLPADCAPAVGLLDPLAGGDAAGTAGKEKTSEMPQPMEVMPGPVSFTPEELQKLDAEAAWDELEAEEEKDGWDCPLLPQLVAASPIALSLKKASTGAQPGSAGIDSPKRKRGRPKGSGKKNKSRLEISSSTAPAAVAAAVTVSDALNQDSPSIPLYDSQSPGCSAATNSPPSLWSGSSVDTFPPLADLLDISADPMGLLGSGFACPPLASPATPSSRGSSMLRSASSASFNSIAAGGLDEAGGMKGASPRVRSARIHAGVQARRLFGVEEEAFEELEEPLFVPKETKKSSKSKTGRPRGRPRKIRPNERPGAEGEDQ